MTRRIESVSSDRVIVSEDADGALGILLHALMSQNHMLFLELKRGASKDIPPDLHVERAGDQWRLTRGTRRLVIDTDEVERLYYEAYDTRRMQYILSFPIGSTLFDGNFEITANLRGNPERGMYSGREVGSGRELLITLGGPQTVPLEELRTKLALRVDGIAPLRYIGPVDAPDPYVAMVEDPPRGLSAATALRLPLDPDVAATLVRQVADIVEDAPHAVIGLRPQLIFIENGRVSGVAPRCEPFLMTVRRSPSQGWVPCFDEFYLAPEVIAGRVDESDQRADVFSLAAILAHWVMGHHPFEGEGQIQGLSIQANVRRPAIFPHKLADIIEAGLSPDPDARPELIELAGALRRAVGD